MGEKMVTVTFKVGVSVNNDYGKYTETIDKLISIILNSIEPVKSWKGLRRNAVAITKDAIVSINNAWNYYAYQDAGKDVWFVEDIYITLNTPNEKVLLHYVERLLKTLEDVAVRVTTIWDVAIVGDEQCW